MDSYIIVKFDISNLIQAAQDTPGFVFKVKQNRVYRKTLFIEKQSSSKNSVYRKNSVYWKTLFIEKHGFEKLCLSKNMVLKNRVYRKTWFWKTEFIEKHGFLKQSLSRNRVKLSGLSSHIIASQIGCVHPSCLWEEAYYA